MKKHLKTRSLNEQLFVMMTILALYFITIFMSKSASSINSHHLYNGPIVNNLKSMSSPVDTSFSTTSAQTVLNTEYASANLVETVNAETIVTTDDALVDNSITIDDSNKADFYKDLYTPKIDYSKVVIDGYTFNYIPGAPSSIYSLMAENAAAAKDAVEEVYDEEYIADATTIAEYEPISYPSGSGVLTPTGGVNYFGDQKETYYNLPMNQVVLNAQNAGIAGEYWVRDDGCKMLGNYIMIAANQSIHPYGSLVETSLGTGIVVDTGGFAANNPYQVDIATAW